MLTSLYIDGKVVLENGVLDLANSKFIGVSHSAFAQISSIRKVIFPQGVFYLGLDVFRGCLSLNTVEFKSLSDDLQYDSPPFVGDSSLTNVIVPPQSQIPAGFDFHDFFSGTPIQNRDWEEFINIANEAAESGKISGGIIALIIIIVVVVVVVIIISVYCLKKKSSNSSAQGINSSFQLMSP